MRRQSGDYPRDGPYEPNVTTRPSQKNKKTPMNKAVINENQKMGHITKAQNNQGAVKSILKETDRRANDALWKSYPKDTPGSSLISHGERKKESQDHTDYWKLYSLANQENRKDYKEGNDYHMFKHIQMHGPNTDAIELLQNQRISEEGSSNPPDLGVN